MTEMLISLLVVLCLLNENIAFNVCPSNVTAEQVDACISNTKIEVKQFYLNTGQAPLSSNSRCKCVISVPSSGSTNLSIRLVADHDVGFHSVEINKIIFNKSMWNGRVVINLLANLWVTTDGFGGVCPSVSSNIIVNIICFQAGPSSPKETKEGASPTLPVKGSKEPDENEKKYNIIIGAVAGAVGGFLALVAIMVLVMIYRRRRNSGNVGERNTTETPAKSDPAQFEDYEMTENPMYDKTEPDNCEVHVEFNRSKPKNGKPHAVQEKKHRMGESSHPVRETEIHGYSLVTPHVQSQSDNQTSDNVYDQSGTPYKVTAAVNEYDHFCALKSLNVAASNIYDTAKTNGNSDIANSGYVGDYNTAALKQCVSYNACPEISAGKVIHACTSDNISLAEMFYINTGLAPTNETNRCRCIIHPQGKETQLSFILENGKSDGNQELEVNGVKFNPSDSVVTVLINDRTEFWVSTNGIGGICLLVEIAKPVDMVCERIIRTTDTKMGEEDLKNEIIGPVAGAVGGFLVVLVVLIVAVLYKRRRKSGKNENPTNSADNPTGSYLAKSEDPYETMTENPMYDKTKPESLEMQESSNSLKLKAVTETVAKRNEHKMDGTSISGNGKDMYVYSAIKPRVKPQSNYPVSDNVNDQTSKPNKVMPNVNEYDHLSALETNVLAINVYDSAKIDYHSNIDKTGHSCDYDTAIKSN